MRQKLYILLTVILATSFVLTACKGNTPVSTPDPCAEANLTDTMKPIVDGMHAFDDTTFAGNITPQQSLVIPILDLQKTRRAFEALTVASCLDTLKSDGIDYMNSVIQYLGVFMAGGNQETVTNAINASQELRINYEKEKARLLGQTFTVPPTRTPGPTVTAAAPTAEPTQSTIYAPTGVTIINNGVDPINLRSAPSASDSEVVDHLAAGGTAEVLAKNTAGDWLMISYNGKQVWVFGAVVVVNGDLAKVPVQP